MLIAADQDIPRFYGAQKYTNVFAREHIAHLEPLESS
jgi:hypothetical protein